MSLLLRCFVCGDDAGVDDDNDADVIMMCKRSLAPTKGVRGRGPEEGGRVGERLFLSVS